MGLPVRVNVHHSHGSVSSDIVPKAEGSRQVGGAGLASPQGDVACHPARGLGVQGLLVLQALVLWEAAAEVLKLQHGGHQAVGRPHVHQLQAAAVAELLVLRQLGLHELCHLQQPLLVDEREEHHGLPRKALAIDVDLEVLGVKVQQRGLRVGEEPLEGLRQRVAGGRWQHAHQLVEGLEGLPELKGHLYVRQPAEIRGKGRIVVGVVPRPGGHPIIVVPHHPAHTLDVVFHHVADELGLVLRGIPKLLLVVALPPARLPKADLLLTLYHVVKHVRLLLHALPHLLLELLHGLAVLLQLLLAHLPALRRALSPSLSSPG
mmetsp:Transcript_3381/g.9705  ORF Transcript_3381/g.9705 Transcript_3381/m.9705 type:complete len:319 (-) Transcript_3381:2042-2998(-)